MRESYQWSEQWIDHFETVELQGQACFIVMHSSDTLAGKAVQKSLYCHEVFLIQAEYGLTLK
jgi:hypothetical protein